MVRIRDLTSGSARAENPAMLPILPALVCASVCAAQAADSLKAKRPPNIVLLYADDAGYADFGFQTKCAPDMKSVTPRIDSIARAGVRFTNAYMSGAVCSPSRAGMLTGRYQTRFGHESNIPPGYMAGGLPLEETLIPARLKPLGYATGIVGKWHLGYPPAYHPNKRGFDWFYGLLQGSRGYFPLKRPSPHRVVQENGKPTKEQGYVTDRFGDAAVRFIEAHKGAPFFLFVSFTAPHGPLQAKPSHLKALENIAGQRRRKYAGLIKSLDENVGKVLDALRRHQLDANTLVIFTNDNGGQTRTGANNAPLRGRKGMLLEGGIRVPMCMRWPGRIQAGSVIGDPVISLDFLPTFVAMGGGEVATDWELDGVNLIPRLTGASDRLAKRPLFWRRGGPNKEIAMRYGDLKLHFEDRSVSPDPALYDLAADIAERNDIAGERGASLVQMRGMLSEWEQQLVAPKWGVGTRRKKGRRKRK
jgi:arylsulfatase A-like enzyme